MDAELATLSPSELLKQCETRDAVILHLLGPDKDRVITLPSMILDLASQFTVHVTFEDRGVRLCVNDRHCGS